MLFPESLTKGEVKGANARIEKFDLEGSVYDRTFLPDELIETRLPNFAAAVRRRINAVILAERGAVQRDLETNWLPVLRRSQNEIQVTAMESEHHLAGSRLQHS